MARNNQPASYEQIHLSMLAGLLGNVGCKSDEESEVPGRAASSFSHPGAHLSKKPGKWIVCGRIGGNHAPVGRGIAAIEPQWLEGLAAIC